MVESNEVIRLPIHTLFSENPLRYKNLKFYFFAVFGVRPPIFFLTGQEHVWADCYEAGITNFDPPDFMRTENHNFGLFVT